MTQDTTLERLLEMCEACEDAEDWKTFTRFVKEHTAHQREQDIDALTLWMIADVSWDGAYVLADEIKAQIKARA